MGEFFEFTPGVLRGLVDPTHMRKITFKYQDVLEHDLGVEFVQGEANRVTPARSGPLSSGVVDLAPLYGVPRQLHFDYCVVAVGVSNGLWKPRLEGESDPMAMPVPKGKGGSQAGVGIKAERISVIDERQLEARFSRLRSVRERLASAKNAIIVGAGLVGVELAGELCHFFPRLKVRLVDGAPSVLPQLAEGARKYAHTWLREQGVSLKLGAPFRPEMVSEEDLVLWCVGTCPRSSALFEDKSVLRSNGQIRVNRSMQVIGKSVDEPVGEGRIYAVGDVAKVDDVPMAQTIFHGEEMGAVAVANIEASEDVNPVANTKRQIESLPLMCVVSLGPREGIFSTQSDMVMSGPLVALQKQVIEDTKMSATQGGLVSSLLWMPIH